MGNKYKYIFDKDSLILFKYYYGPITLEDIYSSWDYAIENDLIPKETKGFILDYREANFTLKPNEFPEIANYYKNHLAVFKGLKIAILSQNPRDVVIPTLVQTKDEGYESRPFYTLDAALDWILGKFRMHQISNNKE